MNVTLPLALSVLAAQPPAQEGPDDALVKDFAGAVIAGPPESLGLDPFYRKYTDAFGVPIIASEQVPDAALLIVRDVVNYMLAKRPMSAAS